LSPFFFEKIFSFFWSVENILPMVVSNLVSFLVLVAQKEGGIDEKHTVGIKSEGAF